MYIFGRAIRVLICWMILGCDASPLAGTYGAGSPGTSNPTNFGAEYILAFVEPDAFVPAAGFVQKSVIGRCVEIKPDGTLLQEILYSQNAPAALTREVDTWSYSILGSDIVAKDPVGTGSGPVSRRIGSTTGTQIVITRVLRNNGNPVIRTLTFSRINPLSPRCGS